ncbi:MAG: DUF2079 domain-containing protein [Bacteroidia bacterium]|nr:DUF2079 domain-containing protein [Bacteroidia bacterium]MDW8015063.1 DUF2079 domain-containing protein [Bacteroidia bacterium]
MPRRAIILVLVVWLFFMSIMGLVTFPNHYNFRTFGDLAYISQVLENHSKGYFVPKYLSSSNFYGEEGWVVVPHAAPTYHLALPFYWIGGVWGALVYQWLLVGLGGLGLFLYAKHRLKDWRAGLLSMIHYFGMWGLVSLLAFDWHEVLIWIPFVLYGIEQRKWWIAFLTWLFFIGSKESAALWGVWIALILVFVYKAPEERRFLLVAGGIAALWFAIAYFLYKPDIPAHSRMNLYSYLGADDPIAALQSGQVPPFSFKRIVRTLLLRPQLVWTLLWESPYPDGVGIKSELHWSVLWSGGWAFVFQPLFLLLLLPVYMYKLLASDYMIWGTLYHYSVEFAVILPIAVLWAAQRWKGNWRCWTLLAAGALGAHIMGFSLLEKRVSKWYEAERHRWYAPQHYHSPYNYSKIHEGLRLIPPQASVSAVSRLISHIPPRWEYYHFPAGLSKVEYIALLREDPNPWPVGSAKLIQFIDSLEKSPSWEKIWDKDKLVVFHRRSS